MSNEMNLNEYLIKLRNDMGVTQKNGADYLGVDVSTYAHYESGRRTPNYEKLQRIAEYYNLDDELIGTGHDISTNYIEALMKNMNLSIEEAMDAMDIFGEKRARLELYYKTIGFIKDNKVGNITKKNKYYLFKKICNCPGVDIRRVFPTKQKVAKKINESFKNDKRIACIILFGSSVTIRCNSGSDLDLMVRLSDKQNSNENKNEISEKIQELTDWNADIIWYDRIDKSDRIYKNILKGVQIV